MLIEHVGIPEQEIIFSVLSVSHGGTVDVLVSPYPELREQTLYGHATFALKTTDHVRVKLIVLNHTLKPYLSASIVSISNPFEFVVFCYSKQNRKFKVVPNGIWKLT